MRSACAVLFGLTRTKGGGLSGVAVQMHAITQAMRKYREEQKNLDKEFEKAEETSEIEEVGQPTQTTQPTQDTTPPTQDTTQPQKKKKELEAEPLGEEEESDGKDSGSAQDLLDNSQGHDQVSGNEGNEGDEDSSTAFEAVLHGLGYGSDEEKSEGKESPTTKFLQEYRGLLIQNHVMNNYPHAYGEGPSSKEWKIRAVKGGSSDLGNGAVIHHVILEVKPADSKDDKPVSLYYGGISIGLDVVKELQGDKKNGGWLDVKFSEKQRVGDFEGSLSILKGPGVVYQVRDTKTGKTEQERVPGGTRLDIGKSMDGFIQVRPTRQRDLVLRSTDGHAPPSDRTRKAVTGIGTGIMRRLHAPRRSL